MVKIKKRHQRFIQKVLYWIFLIFLTYLIYEILLKLVGGSLAFETLVIGLLITNLGYSFYLRESIDKIGSKILGI